MVLRMGLSHKHRRQVQPDRAEHAALRLKRPRRGAVRRESEVAH